MSLVAYEDSNSSDDESDVMRPAIEACLSRKDTNAETKVKTSLSLPEPKHSATVSIDADLFGSAAADFHPILVTTRLAKLPEPKSAGHRAKQVTEIEEAEDDFLKKAVLIKCEIDQVSHPATKKNRVRIPIPALKDFSDVPEWVANKASVSCNVKTSGLLSLLPDAKSERNYAKSNLSAPAKHDNSTQQMAPTKSIVFVPDSVKSGRSALSTENVDGIQKKPIAKPSLSQAKNKILAVLKQSNSSDNEASDEEDNKDAGGDDFFALNVVSDLPAVSANEINFMVAKCAANMTKSAIKYPDETSGALDEVSDKKVAQCNDALENAQGIPNETQLDVAAVHALEGSGSKRRRIQSQQVEFVDISSDQVLPTREEWMRTALASSTTYQPTGMLVDEEPVAGTRRKHQITYLAHRAKANEAELQAMWAANRQSRRATQSKYGF